MTTKTNMTVNSNQNVALTPTKPSNKVLKNSIISYRTMRLLIERDNKNGKDEKELVENEVFDANATKSNKVNTVTRSRQISQPPKWHLYYTMRALTKAELACLRPDEIGDPQYSIEGWLESIRG